MSAAILKVLDLTSRGGSRCCGCGRKGRAGGSVKWRAKGRSLRWGSPPPAGVSSSERISADGAAPGGGITSTLLRLGLVRPGRGSQATRSYAATVREMSGIRDRLTPARRAAPSPLQRNSVAPSANAVATL
jgi:hypothetical protein